MAFKILNTVESFSPEAKAILDTLGAVDYAGAISQEEFERRASEYDVFVVRLGVNVTRSLIKRSPRLQAIATATTGLDHIDLDAARERGIEVVSLRGETEFLDTITGTAELAFGLLIDLARLTPWAFEAVKRYEWELERYKGHTLAGKTLGVVGLGRLGRMSARYGKAFGMRVLFCDPDENAPDAGLYDRVSFDALVGESDAISLHVHLLPETEGMFNADVFKRMKKSAYLVNTSRGKIVNEEALIAALLAGEIAGYATDVLEGETDFITSFFDHPLVEYARTHENCIIVPHTGGLTHESRRDTDVFIARKLLKYLTK